MFQTRLNVAKYIEKIYLDLQFNTKSLGNKRLHEKLVERNIPHDYIERPGNHTWDYWANSIKYQLLFFSDYFDSQKN